MSDWATISSLATAGGTLVLAVATFASVRAGQRAARVAERSFLIGMRPVLFPARREDPVEKARLGDGTMLKVPGGTAAVERGDGGELYFANSTIPALGRPVTSYAPSPAGFALFLTHTVRERAGRTKPPVRASRARVLMDRRSTSATARRSRTAERSPTPASRAT